MFCKYLEVIVATNIQPERGDLPDRGDLDPQLHHCLRPHLHQHLHHPALPRDQGPLQV